MEELKIQLTYNPDYFREIYYKNGQGSILTYKPVRKFIIAIVALTIATVIIYFLSYKFPGISWLIVVGLVAIFIKVAYAIIPITTYAKWKTNIETYLKEVSQYKSYSLAVTAHTIEVALDSKISIEKWDNIKSANIENDHIILRGDTSYIFPARTMKPEEFEKLKEICKMKMKQ